MQLSINEKFQLCLSKYCLLRVRVCLDEANPWLEFSIRLNWYGARSSQRALHHHSLLYQDSIKFLESLFMYSCSKCLPHPSRWIAGLSIWKLLYFCNSWEKFKIFLPSFWGILIKPYALLDYANLNSVLKMSFLFNIDTYFIPIINIKNGYL